MIVNDYLLPFKISYVLFAHFLSRSLHLSKIFTGARDMNRYIDEFVGEFFKCGGLCLRLNNFNSISFVNKHALT